MDSRFRPTFFFWLALAMCFFVFAGFGLHSALPALRAIGLTVSLGVAACFLSALLAARPLLTKMS